MPMPKSARPRIAPETLPVANKARVASNSSKPNAAAPSCTPASAAAKATSQTASRAPKSASATSTVAALKQKCDLYAATPKPIPTARPAAPSVRSSPRISINDSILRAHYADVQRTTPSWINYCAAIGCLASWHSVQSASSAEIRRFTSAFEWTGDGVILRRSVPFGTVGYPIGWIYIP